MAAACCSSSAVWGQHKSWGQTLDWIESLKEMTDEEHVGLATTFFRSTLWPKIHKPPTSIREDLKKPI